jgi:hypothetical protein
VAILAYLKREPDRLVASLLLVTLAAHRPSLDHPDAEVIVYEPLRY